MQWMQKACVLSGGKMCFAPSSVIIWLGTTDGGGHLFLRSMERICSYCSTNSSHRSSRHGPPSPIQWFLLSIDVTRGSSREIRRRVILGGSSHRVYLERQPHLQELQVTATRGAYLLRVATWIRNTGTQSGKFKALKRL